MRSSDWTWLILLALAFTPALLAMGRVWTSVDYYSHGFFIPVFSLVAFLGSRRQLGPPDARDGRGDWLIAGALLVYALGLLAGSAFVQGLAFVGAVGGLVLRLWGTAGLRRLAFPVGFLLFMVPVPSSVIAPVIVGLQLFVSACSLHVLAAVGVDVVREGNVLWLPSGESLFVAEACSGITSIVTLLPLGALIAYFTQRSPLRRGMIVAAVVPLAMLGNLLRVVVTAVAAHRFGTDVAAGTTFHETLGLATFALTCVALLALVPLLGRETGRPPGGQADLHRAGAGS